MWVWKVSLPFPSSTGVCQEQRGRSCSPDFPPHAGLGEDPRNSCSSAGPTMCRGQSQEGLTCPCVCAGLGTALAWAQQPRPPHRARALQPPPESRQGTHGLQRGASTPENTWATVHGCYPSNGKLNPSNFPTSIKGRFLTSPHCYLFWKASNGNKIYFFPKTN